MNSTERLIYDNYAYDKTYVFLVYSEFERRVNATCEEYEGLKNGECRFDYRSWENRLHISRKQLQMALKFLTTEMVIKQVFKGCKGKGSSIYFLTRFEDNKKDNKKDNNKDNNKASKINGLGSEMDNKKDKNKDNKKDTTSKYNNPNIESINNIYSSIIDYLNGKAGTSYRSSGKKTRGLINARINDGFKEEDFKKVIDIKVKDWLGTEWQKFLRPETLFGPKFEGYLNQKGGLNSERNGINRKNENESVKLDFSRYS